MEDDMPNLSYQERAQLDNLLDDNSPYEAVDQTANEATNPVNEEV